MTIAEFLLARIEEDEAQANMSAKMPDYCPTPDTSIELELWCVDCGAGNQMLIHATRVLAECAAKRAIIRSYHSCIAAEDTTKDFGPRLVTSGMVKGLELAVKYLAGTYHAHPDYERDWADETIRSMRKHEVIPRHSDSRQEK